MDNLSFRERVIWAAAFLDGEGTFYASKKYSGHVQVSASQVDPLPLAWLIQLFGGTLHLKKYVKKTWRTQTVWQNVGSRAVSIMMMVYPFVTPRRKKQIRDALDVWKTWGVMSSRKVTCKSGHSLDGTDYRGKRYCVTCKRKYWREYAQKDRDQNRERYRRYWRERRAQLKVVVG